MGNNHAIDTKKKTSVPRTTLIYTKYILNSARKSNRKLFLSTK